MLNDYHTYVSSWRVRDRHRITSMPCRWPLPANTHEISLTFIFAAELSSNVTSNRYAVEGFHVSMYECWQAGGLLRWLVLCGGFSCHVLLSVTLNSIQVSNRKDQKQRYCSHLYFLCEEKRRGDGEKSRMWPQLPLLLLLLSLSLMLSNVTLCFIALFRKDQMFNPIGLW